MKRRISKKVSLLLCLALIFTMSLTACGKSKDASTGGDTAKTEEGSGGVDKIKSAGVLKVGCKVDVPKFGLQDTATSEYTGLEIDLAYEIAAKIFGGTAEEAKTKKLVEFQGVTAKTRGALLDNGEIDLVIATFTITDDRKKSWNFSTPYFTDAIGLMSLADAPFTSVEDLDGAIIGVAQGSSTKEGIQKYITDNSISVTPEFQEFDGYPALSAALSSGNIDIFSVDRAILAGYNDDTTKILTDRFAEQDYGVASALKNKDLATLVDGVVVELKDSGKLTTMISDWGIE
ncbi:MAG: transporter substrate-binding protein [Anaerocolumna sp.]|jgi:putative glutamine transport system substrate-binding protein|nr:transporter substrate-binding protein [Anaerocolumna sp.]